MFTAVQLNKLVAGSPTISDSKEGMSTKTTSEVKLGAEEIGKGKFLEGVAGLDFSNRNRDRNCFKDPQGLSLRPNGREKPPSILLNSSSQNRMAMCILSVAGSPCLLLVPQPHPGEHWNP